MQKLEEIFNNNNNYVIDETRKTWTEIKAEYPNHFVVIFDPEFDSQRNVLSGVIFCAEEIKYNIWYHFPENGIRRNQAYIHTKRDDYE